MSFRKKGFLDSFGKWNFAFLFRVSQFFSWKWGRKFMYEALREKSIYEEGYRNPILKTSLLGKEFPSPLGIAAGFDIKFKYNDELIQYGFGFEEFGTFTFYEKYTARKIRFLSSQKAVLVDEPFFKNGGIKFAQKELINRRHLPHIAGVSIASNQNPDEENKAEINIIYEKIEKELIDCVQCVAPYCDYIVLNLSHPQLPISSLVVNLGILRQIIVRLKDVIDKVAPILKTKLLLKIPLDVSAEQVSLISEMMIETGIDGIIIGGYSMGNKENHKGLRHYGYSYLCGKPIKNETLRIVGNFYKVLQGRIPIISSGGVFTGDDAFEMIQAGANLVQIHTAILYKGPSIGRKICKRLADLLHKNNFGSVSEAVGSKFSQQ
ncbi:MAG: hypothetical protein J6Y03_05465 [Alphaproteobacteria bacterium]|nr:hypothetical protein [Alphaproteobacteria bacterium]